MDVLEERNSSSCTMGWRVGRFQLSWGKNLIFLEEVRLSPGYTCWVQNDVSRTNEKLVFPF